LKSFARTHRTSALHSSPPSGRQYGLNLGVHCSLCCFGFMMILLATSVMDLGTMALVAAAGHVFASGFVHLLKSECLSRIL
jgi:predicted metal-binding membrane protein